MEVSVQTWLAAICDARRLAFAATGFKRSVNLGFSFKYSHYIAEKARHQLARIGVQFTADWEPGSGSRHIDPTQWAPIVQRLPEHDSGDKAVPERELVLTSFGLLPSFAKDEKYGLCTYNARSKTVATLASVKGIGQRPVTASFPRPASTSLTLPAFDDDRVIAATDLSDIWGVGRRIAAQLREEGLKSALDVMRLNPTVVRRCWSVVSERTVRERQSQPCIAFEDVHPDKQEIASTRSFGQPITELSDLIEAVSEFSARAAVKLRKQNKRAGRVLVFVHTCVFRAQDRQYSNSITLSLRRPNADSAVITATAVRGMEAIYRPGFNYAKAGVTLLDIHAGGATLQSELALIVRV